MSLLVLLALAGVRVDHLPNPEGPIFLEVARGPLFEFAPASGAGMTAECACAPVTDSQGRDIGYSRAGSTYCTKGPLNDGIDVGDMVVCGTNLPRVTAGDNSGVVGLLLENGTSNTLIRSEELENAAWTATAVVTANAAQSPANTTTADQLNDSSGAALQGVSQSVTTSLTRLSAAGCYVRAGTATSVTVSMVGTGNSAGDCSTTSTGLSSTTWRRVWCGSTAAYAAGLTAVTVSINVGTVAADTGTIMVWGCQFEQVNPATSGLGQAFLTSYITTVAGGVGRNADTTGSLGATFALSMANQGSSAATLVLPYAPTAGLQGTGSATYGGATGRFLYFVFNQVRALDGTNTLTHATTWTANVAKRIASSWSGSTMTAYDITASTSTSGAFDGTMETTEFRVGYSGAALAPNGVIKLVCADPDPARCR